MYMTISKEMAQAFNRAVTNPENIQSNGSVNWNYVDADVYMAVGPSTHGLEGPAERSLINTHYALFDVLCNAYEQANGPQVQLDTVV
tara:strand:- start:177 stop:437 length:261 start_codon:yes stop_codon:yes gene_type:complete